MGFIKKNAFLLACALGGIAGLGLMLWGMTGMSRVREEMSKAERLNGDLTRLSSTPVNPQAIEAEQARYDQLKQYHQEVLAHFAQRCAPQPLLENLFPDPPSGPEGKNLRYEFRKRYQEGMRGLLVRLNAGQPPTKEEIDDTEDYLKKKALEATQFTVPDKPAQPAGAKPSAPPGPASPPGGATPPKATAMPERKGPATAKPYWDALADKAKTDPVMLKSISKARSIYCYANLVGGGSFDLHQIFAQIDTTVPAMSHLWDAQMLYWLQRDVVEALARVNQRAAEKLGDEAWVGTLPVKDIVSIRVSQNYIQAPEKNAPPPRADSGDQPPSHADAAFTHQASQDLYDVMNLRLRLIVDVRDLPQILNELVDDRYYAVLNVSFKAVPPDLEFKSKIYGPDPCVEATIDLQVYLFAKSFVPLMPEVIRQQLGISDEQFAKLGGVKREGAVEEEPAKGKGHKSKPPDSEGSGEEEGGEG